MARLRVLLACLIAASATACGGGNSQNPTEPSPLPAPPSGANFSVTPVPVDALARITPIGYNNKTFPNDHTYWLTCDIDIILQGTRPCRRERLELRAPAAGTVADADTAPDGFVRVEGPRGLIWTFGHVTPRPGITRGTTVAAGQVIATMFYEHGFDFGLTNGGVTHFFIAPERYPEQMLHGENPIAQYAEPTRSELLARVNSLSDKLGRLSRDVAGTVSGGWFLPGTPRSSDAMSPAHVHEGLWLGRYMEREETRIVSVGSGWPGMPNVMLAADPAAPSWEDLTPASGEVRLKLWNMARDATANLASPAGTLLVQLIGASALRIEWFNTHGLVSGFTAGARTYER
jgi:hypothetical protein